MKTRRISVCYRENCGGILRNLASGLCKTFNNIAEFDLYEDLRERVFKEQASLDLQQKQKKSA
jgi:hypothetical protein